MFGPVAVVLSEAGVTARCSSPPWPCDGEHLESLCSAPFFPVPSKTRQCSEQYGACRHMAPKSPHRVRGGGLKKFDYIEIFSLVVAY